EAFRDLDGLELADFHVHLAGLGRGGSGIEVNPASLSVWHPLQRARTAVYMSASGVRNNETTDEDYVRRLVDLARGFPKPIKCFIFALDRCYRFDGSPDPERTSLYVPNKYVFRIAAEHPDLFVPVMSVNPYRTDAIDEIEKWAKRGCRHLKWLPN